MPVTINGDGSITGLSVGGLPNGSVDADSLASNAVTSAKIASGAITSSVMPASSIVQVVQGVLSSQTSHGSSSYGDLGISASITPQSSSKVLCLISIHASLDYKTNRGYGIKLLRDSTNLWEADQYVAWNEAGGVGAIKASDQASIVYLDSPSSTSALTFKVQGKSSHTSNNGQARFQISNNPSSVTLMEILQ